MFTGERPSSLKNKSNPFNLAAHNVWLAVYPFQLRLSSPLTYSIHLYFEKNLQIIGDIRIPTSNNNQSSIYLPSNDNLIFFRLFSFQNLTYKWSVYRQHESGEEEFIESAEADLKKQIAELVPAQKSSNIRGQESYALPSSVEKELNVKLAKTGISLKYVFYYAEDAKTIQQAVRQRFQRRDNDIEEANQNRQKSSGSITHSNSHPNQNDNNIGVNSRILSKKHSNQITPPETKTQNQLFDSLQIKKQKPESKDSQPNASSNSGQNKEETQKPSPVLDLDALILSQENKKIQNSPQPANSENLGLDSIKNSANLDEDLSFGIKKDQKQNKEVIIAPTPAIDISPQKNQRDFSILKLQSDQGRIKLVQIDNKLELQQLEIIEEQSNSRIHHTSANGSERVKDSLKNKASPTQDELNPTTTQKFLSLQTFKTFFTGKFNIKKAMIIFLITAGLIFAVMLPNSSPGAKKKNLKKKSK